MSTVRGDSATRDTDLGRWALAAGSLAAVLLVGGLVALIFDGTRLAGLAALAGGVDVIVLSRVGDLWRARPPGARTGRDALGMLANKLGALLVPAAAVALVPDRTRIAGLAALVAGFALVAASNFVIMRGRPPLNPPMWKPGTGRPRKAAPAAGPTATPEPFGPEDWLLGIVLLGGAGVVGGFLAQVVWRGYPYAGGWVAFASAQALAVSLSVFVWRVGRREGGDLRASAGTHLAATLGWMLALVAVASLPFDTGFGLVGRGLAFVALGLLVLGHLPAWVTPMRGPTVVDRLLIAVLAVCLPLALLAAYGWFVRLGADYVATYGTRTTIVLPARCTLTLRFGEGDDKGPSDDISCGDATWEVRGVTYTGQVTGSLDEMGSIVGHVGSVEGYATKERAFGADFVRQSRPTGPVARFGRVPDELGLAAVGVVAAVVLLLWHPGGGRQGATGPRRRSRRRSRSRDGDPPT